MRTKVRNKSVPQYLTKRDGVFYYVRRIPPDLRQHHQAYRFYFSLRTGSSVAANRAANSITQKLDAYWMGLRLETLDIPSLKPLSSEKSLGEQAPLLSEAAALYLRLKGIGRLKKFHQSAERNLNYAVKSIGDRPITTFTAKDATKFRDWLLAKGLTVESVKRSFAAIRAIVNLAVREYGLDYKNPFSNTFMPDLNDRKRRKTIPIEDIKRVQSICVMMDDDRRWLLAVLADTGMRLAEVTGLAVQDIKLETTVPHIDLRPHEWRPLKTRSSERIVPLTGSALWAAKRIVDTQSSPFAFPRYTDQVSCNANSASATLNKWLKQHVPTGCVIHSLRHAMRDRLRAVECPPEIIDAIGGWASQSIGQKYGDGYPVQIMQKWLIKMSDT